ncbi:hypothetical protein [Legionella clemsonensis]|uniref:Legionella pneumophila major outer membrane protein n=1 Tax=Legionella clemsonensis TaxID=1867846 RepID=A0A222P1C8_9GAMM|nr:hypothetical protein [Legionella clemsonensis]ASQ45637.1 hypothetical protein clem_05405 [Legionella clemsonensis]
MKLRLIVCGVLWAFVLNVSAHTSSLNHSLFQSSAWKSSLGIRYWHSTGNTSWNHDPSVVDSFFGNPGSVLDYKKMGANSTEFFFQFAHTSGLFVKGLVATGSIYKGNLEDKDYLAGQIKFLDTTSSLKNGNIDYLSFNWGGNIYENVEPHQTIYLERLGILAGYFYWRDNIHAFGARCNPDDIGGLLCGPPGFVSIPFFINVISNKARWDAFRVGITTDIHLTSKLLLNADIAYIPIAHLRNEDSHHLRFDLGAIPNILMKANGHGLMADVVAAYTITNQLNIGLGARYWEFMSKGSVVFSDIVLPLNDFDSKRYGIFAQASYTFA